MALNTTPLQDQVAVVAGGSSGIGAATTRLLAEAGAHVLVGYNRGVERAAALVADLPGGAQRHAMAAMVMEDSETLRAAARATGDRWGRCDLLVNSAGFTQAIPHADLDALNDDLFDRIMVSNVRGPFACIRAFAPLMSRTGNALIVNVSSISGFTGSGSNIAYCASKAALDTMGMSLARVLGPAIRVLSVSPAAVNTDFVPGRDGTALANAGEKTPMKRVMQPVEVAQAILASATLLPMSTGTVIVVDGGRHL